MAQIDSVGQNTQDSFGNYRLIKSPNPVNLTATGNAVIALPILGGGTGGNINLHSDLVSASNSITANNVYVSTLTQGDIAIAGAGGQLIGV